MSMMNMRAKLIAYVEPPGVLTVACIGSATLSQIYTSHPENYRYAVVQHVGDLNYEVLDFWNMGRTLDGVWLVPAPGPKFDDPDVAIAATVLLNQ